ncbi:UNKNOWN [Stylonychia lemnae]|uniref:Uncharacterized protein n=1 Tax=Stylonychia lemnae TaxID=5949 RepID=A0A078BBR3_STYLE|nr:UNKNOWN [Stylonychia lemnae]|eukprot:CDW91023.1 UNKNOWN [Stylonychia lemnae]
MIVAHFQSQLVNSQATSPHQLSYNELQPFQQSQYQQQQQLQLLTRTVNIPRTEGQVFRFVQEDMRAGTYFIELKLCCSWWRREITFVWKSKHIQLGIPY